MILFNKFVILKKRDYDGLLNDKRKFQADLIDLQYQFKNLTILLDKIKKEKGHKEGGDYCKTCKNCYIAKGTPYEPYKTYGCKLNIPCLDYKEST